MPLVIHDIFIDPPLAIARLGGSSIPQDPFTWAPAVKPRMGESTSIVPAWSLSVQQDGTVEPVLPAQIVFRDGPLIRPVCPFFEIWARVGRPGSSRKTWNEVALTPSLLAECGASLADLSITVDAKNAKVARRTGNPNLKFGTFPPVVIRADVHAPVAILASSPNGVAQPLIPMDRNIPFGFVQVIRSRPPLEKSDPRSAVVDVECIRFRFTPARGLVYGVPEAAEESTTPRRRRAIPVVKSRAFLNPLAGWANASVNQLVQPPDTYDGADINSDRSLGVVDDTCEARFEVNLRMPGRPSGALTAGAHAFVGPPDFAPDRRPFLSLADELNDRGSGSAARTRGMGEGERDAWIQDLFERVFETASLFNVDFYRQQRASTLTGRDRRRNALPGDGVPSPSRAMGGRDLLRNADVQPPLTAPSRTRPLPLSERATSRHRELSDLSRLRDFIEENPGRIERLVRAPFDLHPGEDIDLSTMRMPPFMRNSNAEPLTLSVWQYGLLMSWVKEQAAKQPKKRQTALRTAALKRRTSVLARVRRVAPRKT